MNRFIFVREQQPLRPRERKNVTHPSRFARRHPAATRAIDGRLFGSLICTFCLAGCFGGPFFVCLFVFAVGC